MTYLLLLSGIACIALSLVHGRLVQKHLVNGVTYPSGQSKRMATMLLQLSTVSWISSGAFIAASPWLLDQPTRSWAVPLACLPILYGVVGNAFASRGRHYGWVLFAIVLATAVIGARS